MMVIIFMIFLYYFLKFCIKQRKEQETNKIIKKYGLCFECKKNPRDIYGSHCNNCHMKEEEKYNICEICQSHYD